MSEVGNLIDLTPGEEAGNEEAWFEEPEESIVASNSFKGPYDPFDSLEKEACAKEMALKAQITENLSAAEAHYPDLSSESPPVCMRKDSLLGETPRQRCTSSSFQKQLLKLNASRSAANLPKSKICDGNTPFERTILSENQQMLSAESPLKLVEDDDLASSLKFEQDLRMLRISSLDDPKTSAETEANLATTEDPPKEGDASQLFQRLRALVHQVVDKTNWHLFDAIIDPLSALVGPGTGLTQVPEPNTIPSADSPESKQTDKAAALPYTRQATFDLDLQENWTKAAGQEDATEAEAEVVPGSKVQDFPDAMTCSAATYDGEPRFLAPPEALPSQNRKEFMAELVDDTLALQINELLERHKLGQSVAGGDHQGSQNCVDPRTVILLVNPSNYSRQQAVAQPGCIVQPNPVPLGVANDADLMRRRSSSLSIHDKPKVRKEIAKAGSQDENQQNVPPREVKKTPDFASFRQRRNSFSTTSNPPIKIGDSSRSVLDRIKTPPINESAAVVTKPSGNSKAMIPTKRVAPFVKQPETTYLNPRQLGGPRNTTMPETPVSLRSKPTPKIFATSTPLPQMRSQQRRSLKPTVGQAPTNVLTNASYTTTSFRRPSFSKKPATG
ncbi:hypothetical protein KR054_005942 [Drosophila jambulina]|nr:hypothetical protein KR054_005942 [Drosophila jambulina]